MVTKHGMNVILVGAFNPSIVQPSWLALKGWIKPEEAELAEVEIISRELVSFILPRRRVGAEQDQRLRSQLERPSTDEQDEGPPERGRPMTRTTADPLD